VQSFVALVPYSVLGFAADPAEITRATKAARELLRDAERRVRHAYPGLEVESTLVAGSPGGALVEASADASLVVVGSRGLGGFAGLLLGSVGEQLAAHSKAPVIVIRPPHDLGNLGAGPPHRPVVVGVDGIPDSDAAVAFAFDEASAQQVPLRALYAWWTLPISHLGPTDRRHYDLDQAEDEARRMLAESVAGWREKYADVAVELVPTHTLNPVVALLDASDEAGLLVVSRHGGNALSRLVFVSVADTAVRRASCPVAVVPAEGA
jgi:nucleotide-binding universal stress UspA family protein